MPPLARSSSRPTFGKSANKFLSRGCFGENGEVWCFCNTEPRIEALRRVTRKESSPNLGRKGRQKVTPPPPEESNSRAPVGQPTPRARPPSAATPTATSPTHRSPSKRPHSPPTARSLSTGPRPPIPVSERFDDVDLGDFTNDLSDEDDIDDIQNSDTDVEPDTQYSSGGGGGGGGGGSSPTKKPRFTSFSTPTKATSNQVHERETGFAEIKNDPDSPFHSIRKNLFGPASRGTGIDSTPPAAPQTSSPTAQDSLASRMPPSSPVTNTTGSLHTDSLNTLSLHLEALTPLLSSLRKDKERDLRLIEVGKRKQELWRKKSERLELDNDRLKIELDVARDKVTRLEEEIRELRTR